MNKYAEDAAMERIGNINRKELIKRYLDAETSVEEERQLAESFADNPPQDKEEEKIAAILAHTNLLAEADKVEDLLPADEIIAEEEFDRIISKSGRRRGIVWGISSAMAAAAAILLFLLIKPATPQPEDNTDLIQQIQNIHLLSQISLEEADKCEFRPIEGGYVMTAYFPDGESASYLLIAEENGNSYSILSLNQ